MNATTTGAHPNHAAVPAVDATGLERRFGTTRALADVSLSIRSGEFFSLLGPSGCGKTTLLRMIAGLDLPDVGTLRIGGIDAAAIPAHLRPVNTVFQSYALFPHMTVGENVAFGLRMKKIPTAQITVRVQRVLALVRITELEQRRPDQLSGGQKQRVALARALVNEPKVLLLDEPLGALDLKLRKQLQVELHQLQRRLGITFLHVTHDQDEALVMSDRIAVMNAGRIEQLGTAEEIYERPRTRFVAQFIGSCNLITGKLTAADSGGFRMKSQLGDLHVQLPTGPAPTRGIEAGTEITVGIRPEKVTLAQPDGGNVENCVEATIDDLVYCGAETHYYLRAGDFAFTAVALNVAVDNQKFRRGEKVPCHLPSPALVLLDD